MTNLRTVEKRDDSSLFASTGRCQPKADAIPTGVPQRSGTEAMAHPQASINLHITIHFTTALDCGRSWLPQGLRTG